MLALGQRGVLTADSQDSVGWRDAALEAAVLFHVFCINAQNQHCIMCNKGRGGLSLHSLVPDWCLTSDQLLLRSCTSETHLEASPSHQLHLQPQRFMNVAANQITGCSEAGTSSCRLLQEGQTRPLAPPEKPSANLETGCAHA